ncbi:MAG: hypothetical protein E7638_00385 [Ruminococcaceae bacterium]|nr:hypothetical protein [Oscillospiraceae bacterium]
MKKRIISTIMALVMAFSVMTVLSVSSYAAYSAVQMNVSSSPCSANLSASSLPQSQTPSQGDTYYINLAATTDFKLDRASFYVKAPGQSSFSCIYTYDPSGYFRWVNCSYNFSKAGTYTVRIEALQTNGAQGYGEFSLDVKAKTGTSSSGNTYSYSGSIFNVVPNLNPNYCYNQNNYSRFINCYNKNVGCTATAMCTAYSIYHNTTLSPNSVKWTGITHWEYCTYYSDSSKTYTGDYSHTQSQALTAAYYSILSDRKPIIVGVNGSGSRHVVTIVGVKQGADRNNLKLSDFLIVDPAGGTIESLSTYSSIDSWWGIRVPR